MNTSEFWLLNVRGRCATIRWMIEISVSFLFLLSVPYTVLLSY